MLSNPLFSIVSPVFNEEEVILFFYDRLKKALAGYKNYEIILVDDGSTDGTRNILKKIAEDDRSVRILTQKKNFGQTEAILVGLENSVGRAVIVLDCDLQDPPELVPQMLELWRSGSKIVLPKRLSRQDTTFKKISAKVFYFILNIISGGHGRADFGEFYLVDWEVVKLILKYRDDKPFIRGLIMNLNIPFSTVEYNRAGREFGRSGYSFKKMLGLALQAIKFNKLYKSQQSCHSRPVRPERGRRDRESRRLFSGSQIKPGMAREGELRRVAIIGGGIGGLALGYFLSKKNIQVTIFEKEEELGGLLCTSKISGTKLENYYHHFFTNDHQLLKLIDELGIKDQVVWASSSTGFLKDGDFYKFGGVRDLFKLPFLSLLSKIGFLFGLAISYLIPQIFIPNHLKANRLAYFLFGCEGFGKIWRLMIEGKFHNYSDDVSAKWLLARLKARAGSRTIRGEKLGYLKGSFNILIKRLLEEITKNGGKIKTGFEVKSVENKDGKFLINKNIKFDQVISTVPKLTEDYLGVICVVLTLKKKLTPFYWTTVLDRDLPFKVMVEQSNLLGSKLYSGNSILYLGQYIESEADLFKSSDENIQKLYLVNLRKIFPNVDSEIIDIKIFRSAHAQPVIKSGYTVPIFETNEQGFYEMTMSHIFPNDRGVNDAILKAKKLSKIIGNSK